MPEAFERDEFDIHRAKPNDTNPKVSYRAKTVATKMGTDLFLTAWSFAMTLVFGQT